MYRAIVMCLFLSAVSLNGCGSSEIGLPDSPEELTELHIDTIHQYCDAIEDGASEDQLDLIKALHRAISEKLAGLNVSVEKQQALAEKYDGKLREAMGRKTRAQVIQHFNNMDQGNGRPRPPF